LSSGGSLAGLRMGLLETIRFGPENKEPP
jgi:hypothetical protein